MVVLDSINANDNENSKNPRISMVILGENSKMDAFDTLIGPEEEDNRFSNEIYSLNDVSDESLHSMWRVFTASKGDGKAKSRRLENMAWRIRAMRRMEKKVDNEVEKKVYNDIEKDVDYNIENKGNQISSGLIPKKFDFIRVGQGEDSDDLLKLAAAHNLTSECMDDISALLKGRVLSSNRNGSKAGNQLPSSALECTRPVCALFTHSMQRNGANNFSLFLVQKLCKHQKFVVFTPKDGPMVKDFMSHGVDVVKINLQADTYLDGLSRKLSFHRIGMVLANTIMQCDIVLLAKSINIPTIWMIHESWPRDKFEYYAQEVFCRKDISKDKIESAFEIAECVVFPSKMQMQLYYGLYRPEAAKTIYNGIPLARLDQLSHSLTRDKVRESLGYKPTDFVVLHIGTICGRKGQIFTAKACANLVTEKQCSNLKVLMVGARYIRDHEIKYISQITETIEQNNLSWKRWEEMEECERGQYTFTIMDIQAEVTRFYMAADVVVVPSLNEVLPLVICEAMAFKKPVICSDVDAIPEAVTDGVEGLLVTPGDSTALADAILKIYENPSLRTKMGEAGRRRVERQFCYGGMCDRWQDLIDKFHNEATSLEQLNGVTVLVDMDNTIVDWDAEFIKRYSGGSSQYERIEELVRNRCHFEIERNFPEAEREAVLEAVGQLGFYSSLQPIAGAIDALKEMLAEGVDVRLVTSPHPTCYASCASEKYKFVERYLGEEFLPRLIIARDKTYMFGDFLIDDKPRVTGSWKDPQWTQILFSQPYNVDVQDKPRLSNWNDWKCVIHQALN